MRDADVYKILEEDGYVVAELAADNVVPGICTTCCKIAQDVEPDAEGYECEMCGEDAVSSPLILLGVI